MTIYSAALLLFLVMDPLGNIPLFLTALKNIDETRQKRIILRELIIALVVLIVFLLFGQYILKLLHISDPALNMAGGIILFLIAVRMIFPPTAEVAVSDLPEGEPFIVPLAIPLVAGPSAMASVLLLSSQEPGRWPEWLVALVAAWLVSSVILYFSSGLRRFLGKRGLIALERLMGMVLTTVAIQMLMTGIDEFLSIH